MCAQSRCRCACPQKLVVPDLPDARAVAIWSIPETTRFSAIMTLPLARSAPLDALYGGRDDRDHVERRYLRRGRTHAGPRLWQDTAKVQLLTPFRRPDGFGTVFMGGTVISMARCVSSTAGQCADDSVGANGAGPCEPLPVRATSIRRLEPEGLDPKADTTNLGRRRCACRWSGDQRRGSRSRLKGRRRK